MEYSTKKCAACGEVRAISLFNKATRLPDGLASSCKDCKRVARERSKDKIAAQKRRWYDNNVEHVSAKWQIRKVTHKEQLQAYDAEKYTNNREATLERVSEYQKKNPDVYRKAGKKYRAANPDKMCAKAAKRRARLLQATQEWTIEDEWEQFYLSEIYHLSALRTAVLGVQFHVDHMVPLVSKLVCGMHVSHNLQILEGRENSAKRNHYWPDMW